MAGSTKTKRAASQTKHTTSATARGKRKGLAFATATGNDGQWIEEKITDPVSIMVYRRMWDMLYELALPHALRILAEQDAQEAFQAVA